MDKPYKGTIKTEWGRFFTAPNEIFDLELSSHAKIVYLFLCRMANNETGSSFPAQATIAKKCSVSLATAKRALGELKDMDLLAVEKRPGFTDIYIIKHPRGSSHRARGVAHTELGGSSHRARGELTQSYKQDSLNKTNLTTTDTSANPKKTLVEDQDLEVVVFLNMYEKASGRKDLAAGTVTKWLNTYGSSLIKQSIEFMAAYKRPIQNPVGFLATQLQARAAGRWFDPAEEKRKLAETEYDRTRNLLRKLQAEKDAATPPPKNWRDIVLQMPYAQK